MPNFQAQNELVLNRQLKVQSLVIPLKVVGSATPSSVVLSNDEPGVLFLQSQGVDQITPALDSGEVATYDTSTSDAGGVLNMLVKLRNEYPSKIMKAEVVNRNTGARYPAFLGNIANGGIAQSGSPLAPYKDMMLTATLPAFNSAVTIDACVEIQYSVDESR